MTDERFEALETRQTFQDDVVQKLDDALGYQQRQLLELENKVQRLLARIEELENALEDVQGPPPNEKPPHY